MLQNIGSIREHRVPQCVADHCDATVAGLVVIRPDGAADFRSGLQSRKEILIDPSRA